MPLPQTRRQRVDPSAPEAAGICDRCGFLWSLNDLPFQFDFRGAGLQSLGLRVCPRCYDQPQHQLRPKAVPADPVPVQYPRPPHWLQQDGPPHNHLFAQNTGFPPLIFNGVIDGYFKVQ